MSWKAKNEKTPSVFERPLGTAETIMVSAITSERGLSREPVRIHTSADFTAPYSSNQVLLAFKDAWKALRLLKSPDIATVYSDGNKYYKVPTPEELNTWLDQTFLISPTGTSLQSVMKEMQDSASMLPICYLLPHYAGESFRCSIILFISHWRTEASGSFKMLNSLFDYASDLLTENSTRKLLSHHNLGDEVKLLTPSMEELFMPNRNSTSEATARVEKRFAEYTSHLPSVDLPILRSFSAVPSHVKIKQRIYTTSSTSSLVSACRTESISVTSGIHSAYIGAIYRIAESSKRSRSYTIMMPAQTRTHLHSSSPWREQGCWNAAQMLLLTVSPGEDFLTRALTLRQQYAIATDDIWLNEDLRETSEQTMKHFTLVPQEPGALPWITSMGILDKELLREVHGEMKVETVSVWADSMGPGIVLGLWTFRERLNLQIHWNVAFHGDEQIEKINSTIDEILKLELKVDMVAEEVRVTEV